MRYNLSALLSLPTVAGLALSGVPLCKTVSYDVMIPICGEHGQLQLTIPLKRQQPGGDRDCPLACHAACPRKECDAESG